MRIAEMLFIRACSFFIPFCMQLQNVLLYGEGGRDETAVI